MPADSIYEAQDLHEPRGTRTPKKRRSPAGLAARWSITISLFMGPRPLWYSARSFFPSDNPATGILLALATFGVGYVARPVGAFVLGHVGDKFGRKKVLIFTLIFMGASTFLVGCLPPYGKIGVLAPILLVILRLAQGFSASGEQAGANSLTLEHAPPRRRAYYTSFTLSGTQAGLILATAVFLPISRLPEDQLLSWGWRIPFWLSVVVVAVGYIIRRTLDETPAFKEEQQGQNVPKAPLTVLFQYYTPELLRVVLAALVSIVSTIFGVYALSYAVNTVKIDRTTMLWAAILANIVALVAIPLWAMLADRVGRRPVFIFGALASGVLMFAYLWAISGANIPLVFAVAILMSSVVYSASNGVWPCLYEEMFDTRVRLSGMAIGTQIGFALAGFAPAIASAVQGTGPDSWVSVALLTFVVCVIASIAAWTARETHTVPMHDLGKAALHQRSDSYLEPA
jgi:MFS family permease